MKKGWGFDSGGWKFLALRPHEVYDTYLAAMKNCPRSSRRRLCKSRSQSVLPVERSETYMPTTVRSAGTQRYLIWAWPHHPCQRTQVTGTRHAKFNPS